MAVLPPGDGAVPVAFLSVDTWPAAGNVPDTENQVQRKRFPLSVQTIATGRVILSFS
jgi:hypothetical protein